MINDYGKQIANEAANCLVKAIKLMNEIDHNIAFVDELHLEHRTIENVKEIIIDIMQSLYEKSQEKAR